MHVRTIWVISVLSTFAWSGSTVSAQDRLTNEDVYAVIKKIDQLYRSQSSQSEIEMEIVTPHWSRTLAMDAWSMGTSRTFIRIHAPKKEKGVATLRIENEMWNYLPKTNKVIKVPPSMMMSSWMGSDFTNDDLVKEFSLFEDYSYEEVFPPDADPKLLYIQAIPRPDLPVVWARILLVVDRGELLPVWEQYFDEKGGAIRTITYSDVRDFDGRRLPAAMELVPQNKEGHKTVIRYLSLELDLPLDEKIFSLRNLRSAP
jgi:hypothetical protein